MEISCKELGEEIRRLRKELGFSQKDLANGICCQTTISSIEKGRAFPSVDILHFLSIRLNVTMDYFFTTFNQDSQYYIKLTMERVEYLIKQKQYEEILEITTMEKKQKEKRDLGIRFNQFIEWHDIRAKQYLGTITWKECIVALKRLITYKSKYKLHFQDLKIKNVIANVYAENKQYDHAEQIYKEILAISTDLEVIKRLKLKVFFNLSKLYFYQEKYAQSVETSQKGIRLSLELDDISMLGNLYLQSGQSMIKINENLEIISQQLEQALFLYTMQKKEWHINFVKDLLNNITHNIKSVPV
ncbi:MULTISPECIES: helix-turn-helix domain-containing protein [Bacillus]|uniref:helix-turn-helix domain-containing protein n=1 Tax=Bacillus TaxID=1386 RepID=UPI0012FE892B|nr:MULTISPECIES: helix-turn-helix domain-containing protein [Bacillus]